MNRKIIISLIVAFIAIGTYFYADILVKEKIKESVDKRLQSKIGPAQSYEVGVSGSLIDLIRGKVAGLDIQGNKVKLRNGVTLDDLHVQLKGVKLDPRKAIILAIDKASFEGSLAQNELNNYVRNKHPDISDINIALQDGYLTMTARPMMLRYNTIVNAQGTLEISEGDRLILNFNKVQSAGKSASESSCAYLEGAVNPVFDTRDMSFHPKLTSVTIVPGAIKLVGHFDSLDARAF